MCLNKGRKAGSLSPMAVLGRGYAVVRDPVSGQAVRSVEQARVGSNLDVMLRDGTINVKVLKAKRGSDSYGQ